MSQIEAKGSLSAFVCKKSGRDKASLLLCNMAYNQSSRHNLEDWSTILKDRVVSTKAFTKGYAYSHQAYNRIVICPVLSDVA